MISKLDPKLRRYVASLRSPDAVPQAQAEPVDVIVATTGDLSDLQAAGFTQHTLFENPPNPLKIVTGTVAPDKLKDLADVDDVVEVEGPRDLDTQLNYSVPEIHADVLHNGTPARKGAGVVIGVIDSGIDWRHPDFIQSDGKTSRILAIWDQISGPGPGDHAGPNGLGVEYLRDDISNAIQGTRVLQTKDGDKDGHGTHVAGIAAGSGAAPSCCHTANTYIGVAPAADLIIVRDAYKGYDLGNNAHLLDAVDYIFNHPQAAGKPVVINISLGGNVGPHDGTSLLEQAINMAIAVKPSRAVVVAAGNAADIALNAKETLCHVTTTVAGNGSAEIDFKIREGYQRDATLDLWYDRAGALNLEVVTDAGIPSGVVEDGDSKSFTGNPAAAEAHRYTVDIAGTIDGPFHRNNNFRVSIIRPDEGNLPKGDNWKLKLTNPGADPVNLHCWIDRGYYGPVFLPPLDPPDGKIRASIDSTLLIPATATAAISVANHATKTSCCNCWPKEGIVDFLQPGPGSPRRR